MTETSELILPHPLGMNRPDSIPKENHTTTEEKDLGRENRELKYTIEKLENENKELREQIEILKKIAEDAKKKSITDTLTDFQNRRGLNEFKNSLTPEDYPLLIFSADLDNLREINNNPEVGHKAGDEYILSYVKFIKEAIPNAKNFRIGGDEFISILKKFNPDLIKKISETITHQLENFNNREQNRNWLKFTSGIDIAASDNLFYETIDNSDLKERKSKAVKNGQQAQIPSSS